MKKALIIAGTASMISQFNMINIEVFHNLGYEVEIACDFYNGNNIDEKEKNRFKEELKEKNIKIHQIDFSRNVLNVFGHIKAYRQIRKLTKNHYDVVHTHMPISAFLTRLAFRNERKKNTKVIYTAHGFHFYKGAPLINWLLYYPLEFLGSFFTDILILINKEDYNLAKERFHAKKIVYTPGIGVDTKRFNECVANRKEVLDKFNVPSDKFILLSVGELIEKKNQKIVIEALHELKNKDIYYLIVGIGEDKEKLENLIKKYKLEENVRLLGYQKEVEKICKCVDCFIHTATREGLGIAPLEAMSSGLPLISSYINGIKDYTENNVSGCCVNPNSIDEVSSAINYMFKNESFRKHCGINNIKTAEFFSIANSKKVIEEVYQNV